MNRRFLAIPLPQRARARIAALPLDPLPGARHVRPDAMHLTLLFLGDLPADAETTLRARLRAIEIPPFPIRPQGVGCFPDARRCSVLWVGVEGKLEPLRALHARILHDTRGLLPPTAPATFHPHITIARFRTPPPQDPLHRWLTDYASFVDDSFLATEFLLFSSVLRHDGPIHSVIERFPLTHPPIPHRA